MRHVQSAELWKVAVQKLTQTLKSCLEEAGRPPPPPPPLLFFSSIPLSKTKKKKNFAPLMFLR